ncbi:ribosomal RNA processing protein 1 homolog [Cydia amplana]|uniref:ribosomal RNA processing protein 1 homolog n=1 Tax=Cydia amplana TaxID=1869771 RepID=UPI002FE60C99
MKVTDKSNEKKRKIKKKPIDKTKKQQVLVVAQEIKFARLLSGNEKKTRDRVLRALKKWLVNCFEKNYEFKEDDFTRVWKGLFYAVWMSDKPLVQEDLCESIAGILDLFPTEQLSNAMLLTKAGFKMLATEWFGIDQHRIDKFLMLVRRYLRGALRCVHRSGWSEVACTQFANMLSGKDGLLALKTPLYARNANSLLIHIADCYLEEISKVSSGEISPESLVILLRPFVAYLSQGSAPALCIASRRVLTELLKHGDPERPWAIVAVSYLNKFVGSAHVPGVGDISPESLVVLLRPFVAYLSQGSAPAVCVASRRVLTELLKHGDTEDTDDADDDDEQDSEQEDAGDEENDNGEEVMTNGALDPRAGRVDVVLHPLPVPAVELVAALKHHLAQAKGAGNRRARRCIQLHKVHDGIVAGPSLRPTKAAKALRALEKKLVANGDELALRVAGPSLRPTKAAKALRALEKKLVANGDELALRVAGPSLRPTKAAKALRALEKKLVANGDELALRVAGPSLRPTKAAKALRALEKKLVANGDELALRGLSRKHRKRLLAKSRAGLSIVEDVQTARQTHNTSNGGWQVEETGEVIKNKTKRKRANKEIDTGPKIKKQKLNKLDNTGNRETKGKNNVKKQKNDKVVDKVKNNVKPVKNDVKHSVKKVKNSVDAKNNVKVKAGVKATNEVKVKDSVNVVKVKDSVNVVKVKDSVNVVKVKDSVNVVKASVRNVNVKGSADKKENKLSKKEKTKGAKGSEAKLLVNNKVKKFRKQDKNNSLNMSTPKKVKFVLKNNSMQGTVDYYKSIRESPSIPYDGSKRPSKTNLKVSTPSPINPFFKKKMTRRASFGTQIVF